MPRRKQSQQAREAIKLLASRLPHKVIVPYSPEWWEARRGKITASSRLAVALDGTQAAKDKMLDEMQAELEPGFQWVHKSNKYMDHGHAFEGECRKNIEFMHDVETYEPGLIFHPELDILACTPDYAITGRSITGEIKCPYYLHNHVKLMMGVEHHDKYWPQVQGQLMISGAEELWFSSYHPDQPEETRMTLEFVAPDKNLHERMLEACRVISDMLKSGRRFGAKPPESVASGVGQFF